MKLNKTIIAATMIASSLTLTACHGGRNPLLTAKKKEAAEFLWKATDYACEKTHFCDMVQPIYIGCHTNPSHYDNPLSHNDTGKDKCKKLFAVMAEYGQKTQQFKNVTAADVASKQAFNRLKPAILAICGTSCG